MLLIGVGGPQSSFPSAVFAMGDITVVKDRVGRFRYIAFRIDGGKDLQTGEVIRALSEASQNHPQEARPRLIHFRDGEGIVRVSHLHRDAAVPLLRSLRTVGEREVRVFTLGTSGTIRKAIGKYLGRASP